MKKYFSLLLFAGISFSAFSQELYVFSEPASNMPAHTLSVKLAGNFGDERHHYAGNTRRYIPEIMFGISKKIMIHAATTFSNMYTEKLNWESVYVYGKYRFLSNDDVHKHFRMAAFTEASYAKNEPFTEDLNLQGDRSGVQLGVIATQLVNKFAASATTSVTQAFEQNKYLPNWALNYSLSAGLLLLPQEYKNYRQLNVNLYTELLGQRSLDMKRFYVDLAPALQFIFGSNSKLNLGYRFQLEGNQLRGMEKYFLVSFEHTFFNALK